MVDKCEACRGQDVDLSVDAFKSLVGGLEAGRVKVRVARVPPPMEVSPPPSSSPPPSPNPAPSRTVRLAPILPVQR